MAFIARNKDNGIEKVTNLDDDLDSINIKQSKSQKYIVPEITDFNAQSIKILNILDSKGINIYDDTRTPGMYLKREKTTDNKKLKNILGLNITENKHHQEEERNAPKSLISFLSNK